MSRDFRQRVLAGSGISNKRVESDIGMKLLKKMGWTEGEGLGKNADGIKDCIQMKRRDENLGLGSTSGNDFKWNDSWWENTFTSALSKLGETLKKANKPQYVDGDSETTSDDEPRTKRVKKALYLPLNKTATKVKEPETSDSEDEVYVPKKANKDAGMQKDSKQIKKSK